MCLCTCCIFNSEECFLRTTAAFSLEIKKTVLCPHRSPVFLSQLSNETAVCSDGPSCRTCRCLSCRKSLEKFYLQKAVGAGAGRPGCNQCSSHTGAAFPCCQCKVSAVPQYHLAMVDGTIRNFCSYECVLTYRVTVSSCVASKCRRRVRCPLVLVVHFPVCCRSNLARTPSPTRSTGSPPTGTITPPDSRPLPARSRPSIRTRPRSPSRAAIPTTLRSRRWCPPAQPCPPPRSQDKLKPKRLQTCCRSQQKVAPLTLPS